MRTFCYVADAVVGYYKALVRGRDGEPYNVGIDRPEISMKDLAEARGLDGARSLRLFRPRGHGSVERDGLSGRQSATAAART
jgi:nucleoside-diphosphate-sugar epimerase